MLTSASTQNTAMGHPDQTHLMDVCPTRDRVLHLYRVNGTAIKFESALPVVLSHLGQHLAGMSKLLFFILL